MYLAVKGLDVYNLFSEVSGEKNIYVHTYICKLKINKMRQN